MKDNKQYNLTRILFAVYTLILAWILLFKMSFSIDELYKNRSINIIPFISLGIEVLQFVLAIGATDITDLIGNTLGGIIGIGVFYLFSKVFKNKTNKIINILASIATILLIALISILVLAN